MACLFTEPGLPATSLISLCPSISKLSPAKGSKLSLKGSNTFGEWRRRARKLSCAAEKQEPKLVTVLGKGGVGKTTAAVLLAKYYASKGRKTCLVVQSSEDKMADALLGHRLSVSPVELDGGSLTAVRLETTKLLLEPLAIVKKADARLGFSQGVLEEVAGEELSVLPGLDSLLAVAVLERLAKPAGGLLNSVAVDANADDFEVVVYDGASSSEALRMFGSPERSRWYLRRFRSLAEKTDVGRVALPSAARILESIISPKEGERSERSTAEIWEAADRILTKAVDAFNDPHRFAGFLVVEPGRPSTVDTALRLWGGAMQAGVHVAGCLLSPGSSGSLPPGEGFAPLSVADLPQVSEGSAVDWTAAVARLEESAGRLLEGGQSEVIPPPVKVDPTAGTVALFLPGFDKSDVKLSQWRGGSELLIDVGDQRRSISIPAGMRGKVSGAKFQDKTLTITLKKT